VDSPGSILTLGSADLDRALAFYRDGLGLPVTRRQGDLVVLDFGDFEFGLYPTPAAASREPGAFKKITLSHNVADNAQVRSLLDRAAAAGARILSRPHVATWGGYSASFADPDGHLWEIACPANLEPADPESPAPQATD
jgi:catechol 2,3-dioxygenase-like lactoylglutathione lyase family enzyme